MEELNAKHMQTCVSLRRLALVCCDDACQAEPADMLGMRVVSRACSESALQSC